jgi:hypothetical protein
VGLFLELIAAKARRRAKKAHERVYNRNWEDARAEFLRRLRAEPNIGEQLSAARVAQEREITDVQRQIADFWPFSPNQ